MAENIINKIEQPDTPLKSESIEDVLDAPYVEQSPEREASFNLETEGAKTSEKKETASATPTPSPKVDDDYYARREREIDNFLAEGLNETFLAMSPEKQKIFKAEGEKTARKINELLNAAKINVSKIVSLIKKWLSLITGINKFFLDQEAKIKADKIIKMKDKL